MTRPHPTTRAGLHPLPSGETFIRRNGGRGSGRPLLLVHGGPGMEHSYLVPGFTAFAGAGMRIYHFDQVGNGRDPRTPGQATLDALSRQLVDVAKYVAEDAGRLPTLVGHSFGCFLVLQAAPWRSGTSDRAPVLINPMTPTWSSLREVDERFLQRFQQAEIDQIDKLTLSGTPQAGREVLARLLPKWVSPKAARTDFDLGAYNAAIDRAVFREVEGYDHRDRLGEIADDALLVFGADDFVNANDFRDIDRPVQSITVPDAGHFPFLEQPDVFYDLLKRHLER